MPYDAGKNKLIDKAKAGATKRRAAAALARRFAALEARVAELEAWELQVRQADERLDV